MTAGVFRLVPPWANYIAVNLVAGVVTPLRAPRGAWTKRLVPAWRRFALPAIPLAIAVLAAMAWLDAPTMRAVATLSPRIIDIFNEITDFGRAGWPLIPLCILLWATLS